MKLPSALYTAVMLCAFTASAEGVNVACPVPSRVPVPIVVVPSLKLTEPVGMPEYSGITVAVNVTEAFRIDGFAEEVTAAVVAACVTVSVPGVYVML